MSRAWLPCLLGGLVAVACSSSSPASSGPGCQALEACCEHITGSELATCVSAATGGTDATCNADLVIFQSMGACGGSGSASNASSGGSSSGHGSTGSSSGGCAALALCCGTLTGASAVQCDQFVSSGVVATCDAALSAYASEGVCGGSSGKLDGGTKDGGHDATVDSTLPPVDGAVTTDPTTCAEAAASKSYIGCDFWPTVTANLVESVFDFTAVVANVQSASATVTVTGPGNFSTTVTVAPHSLADVYLPWVTALKGPDETAADATFPSSVFVKGGAYHLVSTLPVGVYQFNALEYQGVGGPPGKNWSACTPLSGTTGCFSYTNDASLLFPSTSMTGNYRIAGEHGSTTLGGSIAAITATQDGTSVTVTLSSTASVVASAAGVDAGPAIPAGSAGGTMTFTLDAGDVIELVGPAEDASDLSGSLVAASKPVQVIAARQCADQPDPVAACDHLESNVLPIETLGKDYVVTVPTSPNQTLVGHKVRFYGNVDGTILTYSPSQPAGCPTALTAGQVVDCLATPDCATGTDNSSTDGMQGDPVTVACVNATFEVTGNHEFGVSSFMLGGSAVDPGGASGDQLGDPSMSPMVPAEQFRSDYTFLAPTDYAQSFADVVVLSGTELTLDGVAVTAAPVVVNGTWSVVRIPLASGVDGGLGGAHIMTGTRAFGMQVIGYGAYTSYQYPAGLDLAEIAPPP